MRREAAIVWAAAAFWLLGGDDPAKGDKDKVLAALQGRWTMVSVVLNGEAVPAEFVETGKLVVEKDVYRVSLGEQATAATIVLDPSKSPATVDFTYTEGPQKGETLKGIYRLDGDTLEICRGLRPDDGRPSKFAAPADSGAIFAVWKRAKGAKPDKDGAERAELERLKGVWLQAGDDVPAENVPARLVYTGREFVGRLGDKVLFRGRVALDPTADPRTIDLTVESAPGQSRTMKGVYVLDDTTYKGVLAAPGKERPTRLTPEPDSGQKPFHLERVKSAAEAKDLFVREELERFQGTWQLVSAESDGRPTPEEQTKAVRVTITGGTHTVRLGDQVVAHDVAFAIDPTKTPREVTDTIQDGPDKGKEIRGLYQLDGDTLVSCVAPVGKDRPTEFTGKAGSGQTLRVFRRVLPEDKDRAQAIGAEYKRFEGTWRFASILMGGQELPADLLKASRMVLKGDTFEVTDATATYRGTYAVDPLAQPRTIDIRFTEGPDAGDHLQGIYQLEGDTYTVCLGLPGKPRPTEFASKAGTGHVLEVLKREAPR